MQILITGATGFIGSNLIPYLQKHHSAANIKTLGRSCCDLTWDDLSVLHLQGIDAVIHLAGKAHDTKNTSSSSVYFEVNYELTKKLFDLSKEAGVSKFIYASSVKAAADTVNGVLSESDEPNPQTPYGKSKLAAEQYLLSNNTSSIACYILRPCMVHGPGNKGNLNLLYQFASRGIPYPLAAFANQRSFLSIDNFCFVVDQLLSKNVTPGTYQLADDESLSTSDLVKLIAEVRKRKPLLWSIPKGMIQAAARTGDFMKLPLNTERLKKLTESYVVSNQKIKKALGISELPVSAREGLIRTLRSFQANQ